MKINKLFHIVKSFTIAVMVYTFFIINCSKDQNIKMNNKLILKEMVDNLFHRIDLLGKDLFTKNKGLSNKSIENFEKTNNIKLPLDFKFFLNKTDGMVLGCDTIYGLFHDFTIANCIKIEQHEVENKMHKNLIPFSPDGSRSHYCFDMNQNNNDETYKIVYWQHDYIYSKNDKPDFESNNFIEWLDELITDLEEQN